MVNLKSLTAWVAGVTVLVLHSLSPALAQTVTFSEINDAVPGRCYDPATTAPDPVNPNQLNIGINTGYIPGSFFVSAACYASDEGASLAMDTLSFVITAPPYYYISKITFTQTGSTSGSRGGKGFRSASWVMDDDPRTVPATTSGWLGTVNLTGLNKTVVPVSITTALAAAGGDVRSGSASASNPKVVVELQLLSGGEPPPAPVPTMTTISPTWATAGTAGVTLTIDGTNFISGALGSVARWNGVNLATQYVSPTQLTATLSAVDLGSSGTAAVTVFNPAPGGGTSGAQQFTVIAPVPTTTTLSPTTVTAGSAAFTLTVTGTNFIRNSVVRWNGADRATTYRSATQVTASITAADILSAGTAVVTVFNPAPGGGTSNPQMFTVPWPPPIVPVLSSMFPATAVIGGPGFTLAVNGTNFDRTKPGSPAVRWNGVDRTVTYRGSTQLLVSIPASDLVALGTAQVTVVNLAPGGDSPSNALTFTIVPVPPPTPTPLAAVNDQASVSFGTAATVIANVLANDTLGGVTATTSVVSLRQVSSSDPGLSLNTSSGAVSVGAGMPSATHTLVYEICQLADLSNCKSATVTLTPKTIDAVNDVFAKIFSSTGGKTPSVLANDRFNNGAATTLNVQLTLLSPLPSGVTFTNGGFTVAPGSERGDFTMNYQICDLASLTNCDTASSLLEISGSGD
ncbi:MAG: hypothetical protein HOP18_08305 [Deltaproteobacteria bacterium]|nr:hypothetical protein [Deltaproteobacteria bacterium]